MWRQCCLNYEVDAYVEAGRRLPYKDVTLETIDSTYYFFKADILSGQVTYSTDKHIAANLVTIPARRAMEVIAMNKRGEKPDRLDNGDGAGNDRPRSADLLEQESVTRFDNKRRDSKRRKAKKPKTRQADAAAQRADSQTAVSDDKPQAEQDNAPSQGKRENKQPPRQNQRKKRNDNRRVRRDNNAPDAVNGEAQQPAQTE